ncbi:unnamed protein product [Thelazia callipaeda]|uniref:MFS domain-containing protein n=1 Tax=Thelazia callipaeda TaxID=103827 RepID=A0A0N5D3N3_THECL|nr:unnamed protein product [Thelazia callipaeda]
MSRAVRPMENVLTTKAETNSFESIFKLSDLQSCRKYVAFLTLVYFLMVLTQVCNLLFMTFADRKPTVEDFCGKLYPEYIASKNCTSTGSCWVSINESKVYCASSHYDFIPIRNDFEVPNEYVKVGTTLQNVGLMIGAIVAGNLADIYGRKKVPISNILRTLCKGQILLIGTIGMMLSLLATSFAPSFIIFTFLRSLDMFFTGGKHCVSNPYFMENLPDKHRMWMATVVTYSPNYIILSGIAYLCKDWKTLSRIASALTVLPLIMIPFSTSFISYGIAYNMDALAGTVYVNVIILGAARYAINITAALLEFTIKRVGRRLLHCSAVGFIVITMALIFIVYLFTWPQIDEYKAIVKAGGEGDPLIHAVVTFTRFASILAAAMCTELFVLDSVQPTELFPTPVRSTGIAFIQTFNRLGTIVSPLVFIPSKHWPPAPFLMMFITSLADFLLYFFFVPETRGKKLPDNMPGEEPEKKELMDGKISVEDIQAVPPRLKNVHNIKLDTSY